MVDGVFAVTLDFGSGVFNGSDRWLEILVEVRKTEPLEKLVWLDRKEPDNERQEIQHRGQDPHSA